MSKKKTLFKKEMEKSSFKKAFLVENATFCLEIQILQKLETLGLTYEEFAKRVGTSKSNVSRDLRTRGLGRASMERIRKMADALDLDFIPILLPKKAKSRKAAIDQLIKKLTKN